MNLEFLIKAMDEEIAANGENANILKERGRLKMACGDKNGAMQDLKRALELDPSLIDSISGDFSNKNQQKCHD